MVVLSGSSGALIRVNADTRGLKRFAKRWPISFKKRSLQVVTERVEKSKHRFIRRRMTGRPGLKIRTGRSKAAIQSKVGFSAKGVEGTVFIDLRIAPWLRMHEIGGTIKPRSAKFLWIPADGSSSTRPMRIPLSFSEMSFIPTPRGFVVLEADSQKHIFTLVRSVQIPARLGFRAWISKDFSSRIQAVKMVTKIITLTAFDGIRGKG